MPLPYAGFPTTGGVCALRGWRSLARQRQEL